MENENNRILVLRLNDKMFHMFKHPEVNFILCIVCNENFLKNYNIFPVKYLKACPTIVHFSTILTITIFFL